MNTLKFLAVGSSLDSGRDVIGRYRVREASLLPRFEAAADEASPATVSTKDSPWWSRLLKRFRALSPAAPGLITAALTPSGDSDVGLDARVDLATSGNSDAGASRLGGLTESVPPATARERTVRPLQGELRFEKVTVVCNDLHDADFEIVPAPPRPRPAPKSVAPPEVAVA